MEKSHKRNFHENLFLFKGCGNPRVSSELSIMCWLGWVQHILLAFEENVKMSWKWFWIHPASSALCHSEAFHLRSHAVYGNWRWDSSKDAPWREAWWKMSQTNMTLVRTVTQKNPFYSTLGEILPNDNHRTCLFLVSSVVGDEHYASPSTAFASPFTAPIPMTWPWQPNTCLCSLSQNSESLQACAVCSGNSLSILLLSYEINRAGNMTQLVEYLHRIHEALCLLPSTT